MRKLDWNPGLKNTRTTPKKLPPGIRERNGMWHYRFEIKGQRYSGSTELEARSQLLNDALEFRTLERQRILKGGSVQQPTIKPFREAIWEFLEWARGEYRNTRNSAKPSSSWKRIRGSLSSARLFFENEPLANVTAGRIEHYKTWRRSQHVQEVTLRHDLHNISLLFQYGIKQQWCAENPLRGKRQGGLVEIPSDQDAVRMHILTDEEEQIFFRAAWDISRDCHDVCRLILLQGMRPEEVMEMEWANWDARARTLRIPRGKSKAAKRTLDLYDESMKILARRARLGGRWVFPSPRVAGQHIVKLVNPFNEVLKDTGLVMVMYDLRHTIATRWVQSGRDLPTVAAWLGHGSLRSIMKYVHIQPEHMKKAQQDYQAILDEKAKLDGRSRKRPAPIAISNISGLSRATKK